MPDSVTQLRSAGPVGSKRNLAVLGDGFAEADQTAYNDWVQATLIEGVFGRDYFYDDASAWNIFRVNLISVDSGVSVRVYDEHGTPAGPGELDGLEGESAHGPGRRQPRLDAALRRAAGRERAPRVRRGVVRDPVRERVAAATPAPANHLVPRPDDSTESVVDAQQP